MTDPDPYRQWQDWEPSWGEVACLWIIIIGAAVAGACLGVNW